VDDQVVEGDQRGQVGHEHVLGHRELDEAGRHHGREHGDRRVRAERQRRDERERDDDLRGRRRDRRLVGGQLARRQLGRDEQRDDRGDQVVPRERVPVEPGVDASQQGPSIWRRVTAARSR
jgi:hypothetical protein